MVNGQEGGLPIDRSPRNTDQGSLMDNLNLVKNIFGYSVSYPDKYFGNQRAISGINITINIPIICKAIKGSTA